MVPLNDVLEAINDGFVEVGPGLDIRYVNGNAERLLRRTRAELVGSALESATPDGARAHQWPQLIAAIREGRATELSIFYPTQYVWHDVKVVPTEGGGAGLLMRDVTDRQWLIRREAERVYLRNVFESAPVAITVMRGPKHVVEYVNRFGRQLVGNREMEGKPIRLALPELDQPALFAAIDSVYEHGTSFDGRDVHVRFDRQGNGLLEDGWFDISYQPARDFDGKVSGVLSLSIEVTDRVARDGRQPAA